MVEINNDYLDSEEDESVVFGGLYMLANTKEDEEIKTKAKATFKELISDKSNYFDIVLENAVNGNSFSYD